MNSNVLNVLEFDKVLEQLLKYARTENTKAVIKNLKPFSTIDEVNKALCETNEAFSFVKEFGFPQFDGLGDVIEFIEKIKKGSAITIKSIYQIGTTLKCIRGIKDYLSQRRVSYLQYYFDNIHFFKPLEDLIFKVIKDGEEISDFASTNLFNIRKEIRSKIAEIKRNMSNILKTYSKYLQENIFTIRGDRYCIPVKSEYKSHIQGIVHNQSSSGSTYFIEPLVLVNLNNEVNELMENEKEEIQKILKSICIKIYDEIDFIDLSVKNIYFLEFIFCKVAYANEIDGIMPIINCDENIHLISSRHPLIKNDKVVPLTLNFSQERRSIVITGPNTGGKTVALKTLGLMHLMGLSGMFIPAYEGTEIMFLDEIFADIGDEQSIENSLSTFSSHIKNIVNIINSLKSKTLILLDEVGSGTDPEEGSALAISILEYLMNKGCKIMATTHYTQLKTYAIESNDVENASMEFDIETLKPTYRLNVGIPGKSNAFIISKSLGMNEEIISNANKYLSGDTIKFEKIIRSLEEKQSEAIKNNKEIEILKQENKILNEKLHKRLDSIEKEKIKIIEMANAESQKIINDAKSEVDHILKTINNLEMNGINSDRIKDLESARREMKRKIDEQNKLKEVNKKTKNNSCNVKFEIGMEAYLDKISQNVTILTKTDSKGNVTVQAGILKLNVNVLELEPVSVVKNEKNLRTKKDVKLRTRGAALSVDLRGMDVIEAMNEVDKYLDDALVSGLHEVTIIHGKGTGTLRKAITDFLRTHIHVKSYRLGEYNEGGHGVTIVYIK